MKFNLIRFSILVCISLVFAQCNTSTSTEIPEPTYKPSKEELIKPYDYVSDLKVYLKETIADSIHWNAVDTLMIVPLNSCASCVSYTINALSINPFSGKIVLGGNPDDFREYAVHLKNLEEENPTFYVDSSYSMYDYRIGVSGPTMLLKSGDSWKIIDLSIVKWPFVVQLIHWKAPKIKGEKYG